MQGEAVLQAEIVAAEAPPQPQPYATAQPAYGQPQPVYSQPAPVAMPPAAPQTVQVQVPAGIMPGSVFNVQANGQMIPVTVPMGCKPGGLLTVQLPPAVAVQQPVAVVQQQSVVVKGVAAEGPLLTNEKLRSWIKRWCSGDRHDREGLPHTSTWNTSRVTDMSELFMNQRGFNDDISAWDTSSVTTMQSMFGGAS